MSCSNIIKRGYLFDKKIGIIPVAVERKRWYILRQDLTQGYCVLEYYKDEKTAGKGEAPKGFINVYDVVAVQRVPDKKQMFEILCPGVAYRLIANSDLEANEWTQALSSLILYRKDNVKGHSLSMRRIPSSPTHMETIPERHRTLSDSSMQTHVSPSRVHPKSLTIPTPSHRHGHTDPSFHFSHSPHFSHSLPTPPELAASPPTLFYHPPGMQRQRSSEITAPLPSPSTSSDSSSMASGSNISFEAQAFEMDRNDARSRFRVHVKEAENLSVSGPADLVVTEEGITLYSVQTGLELVSWPIGSLRRYGCNNVSFTILSGRFCSTGEGRFQFYTPHCRLINSKVHGIAMAKAGGGKGLPRRSSEPAQLCDSMSRSPHQSHLLYPPATHSSLPPRAFSTSPPTHSIHHTGSQQQYNRIQHSTVPPTTQEQYSKINQSNDLGCEEYSKLQHFSNSMMSLQAMSCTQSAMAPPTSHAPSAHEYQGAAEGVKYTQLDFGEQNSPTESSVGSGVENHHIVQSNA